MEKARVWSLGQEDPLQKRLATHSSILAWRIPRKEEPGSLQFMGSQRVGHDWVTHNFHPSENSVLMVRRTFRQNFTNWYLFFKDAGIFAFGTINISQKVIYLNTWHLLVTKFLTWTSLVTFEFLLEQRNDEWLVGTSAVCISQKLTLSPII